MLVMGHHKTRSFNHFHRYGPRHGLNWRQQPLWKSYIQRTRKVTQEQAANVAVILSKKLIDNPRLIPKWARASFHTCLGPTGCRGCINVDLEGNEGLKDIISELYDIYINEKINEIMSRSDFYALTGIVAIVEAGGAHPPYIQFRYGRPDCALPEPPFDKINTDYVIPHPHFTFEETMGFYKEQFDFVPSEVACIMGTHTLGAAHKDVSGFSGPWVDDILKFDNAYYKGLVEATDDDEVYIQRNVGAGVGTHNNQWQEPENEADVPENCPVGTNVDAVATDRIMFFNTDVCLLRDVLVNANGEHVGEPAECKCDIRKCKHTSTKDLIHKFANSNELFLEEYGKCYGKMLENKVAGSLKRLESFRRSNRGVGLKRKWLDYFDYPSSPRRFVRY